MDGFIFGFLDNLLLILGSLTGVEVERLFKGSGVRGSLFGAAIGNSISDGVGCIFDPALQPMFQGVVIGTLVPIAFIPLGGGGRRKYDDWRRRKDIRESILQSKRERERKPWNFAADQEVGKMFNKIKKS